MHIRITKLWAFIVNILFIVFLLLNLFSCFHLMIEQIVQNSLLCYILAIVFAVFFIFFIKYFEIIVLKSSVFKSFKAKIQTVSLHKITILLLLFVLPFLIRIVLLCCFKTSILGDPGVYIDISKEIAFDKVVIRNADYSSNFPHLFWFGVFLIPAALFSNLGDWVFQVYISLILCFNALLVYGISKALCKSRKGALLAAIIYSYLPSQLFCGLTVTHEYAFAFFLLAAIYVYIIKRNLLSWSIVCILIAFARLINSTGIITIIALLCCILFAYNNTEKTKYRKTGRILYRFISIALLAFIILFVSYCANYIQRKMTFGDVNLNQSSVEWQLYIGGNIETEGRYSTVDVNRIKEVVANSSTVSDSKTELRKLVLDRWMNTTKNPGRFMAFLLSKFCNVWSGTHYPIELVDKYVPSKTGHTLMLVLMLFNNLVYSALVSFSLVGLWKDRKIVELDVIVFLKTAIIGTVCMLLLTETMNKYSLTMIGPIFLLMGYCLFRKFIRKTSLE